MDENCILVIRGAGPIGWPGSAEVVNMQPSDKLIKQGITELPCIGDGRQFSANMLVGQDEIENRKKDGPPKYPENQTPWQEIYRNHVGHMSDGGVLENAVNYQKVKKSLPRDNH